MQRGCEDWGAPGQARGRRTSLKSRGPGPHIQKSGYVSRLWETAVTNVKDRVPQDLADVARTDPSNVLQVVCEEAANRREEAAHKEKKEIQLPGKNGRAVDLRNVYGYIISCAKRFRDVGDLAAGVPGASEYIALPWLIIRTTLSAAINEHEMYGVMIQGQEMVSGLVTHYIVIERVFVDGDSDLATAVENTLLALYASIMDFLLEALRFFPPMSSDQDKKHWSLHKAASKVGHAMTRTFRSMDPTSQATIKDLLNKVSESKTAVDTAASHAYAAMNREEFEGVSLAQRRISEQLEGYGLAQKEQSRRVQLLMEEFNTPIHDIDVRVAEMYDNMERHQAQSHVTRVLDWLSPPGRESKRKTFHGNVSSHRLEGSCAWLMNDQEFLHWQDSEGSSVAWLSGMTGTGKTSLLSMVIDRLRELDRSDESFSRTAYFYASNAEGSDWSDPDEILRDIVRQLSIASGGTSLESAVEQKYYRFASDGAEPSRPTMNTCLDLILALSVDYHITIVIDGLDEINTVSGPHTVQSTRDDLIYGLAKVLGSSTKPIKLLLSTISGSQVEARLRKAFGGPHPYNDGCSGNRHVIEVDASRNIEDLKSFINQQVEERISRQDLLRGVVEGDLRDKIKRRLLEHSNGMFRYANMQIARLCDDRMDTLTVLEELEKPLPDVASLYDRSIDEIREERVDRVRLIAQSALRWLRCAQEPLNKESFLEAISLEGAERPEEVHVRSACRMLIKAQDQSNGFAFTPFVEERLARYPEYSESDCHMMATSRCLRMLNTTAHSVGRLSRPQIAFAWYAKRYWPYHQQRIDYDSMSDDKRLNEERQKGFTEVRMSLQRFIMQGHKISPAFNKWLAQIPDLSQTLDDNGPLAKQVKSLEASSDNPLHIICALGFPELIKAHHRHFDLNKRDRHGRSALTLAVENNRAETAKSLLDFARVDVNEFNAKAAYQFQRRDFAPIACYANAFQAAAVVGSRTMMQVLLDHGARPYQVAGYYGCALQAASLKGHKDVVEFLLDDLNFDPNNQGGFHGNALQAACIGQSLDIVETLLEAGADETTEGGEFGTALVAAVSRGDKDIINALLAHTTDVEALVNAKTAKYGTPLQKAVDMNVVDVVELLIANGADINALCGSNQQGVRPETASALAIAAWGGHKKIVSILCDLQAEVDLTHEENEFHLLHQAAQEGMLDLVQYCLNQGCDINMATNKGAKFNNIIQYQKTPLRLAAMEGHIDIVKLLLQNNARIQHPHDNVTVLHLAAGRGQSSVIQLLIDEFKRRHPETPQEAIDFVNRKVQTNQSSALREAASQGAPSAVSVLLEHGATLAAGRDGVTPLHDAAWFAKPLVAKILLEHIAHGPPEDRAGQINARNRWGKTPAIDAAHRNHIKMFNLLLQHGANCTISDADGNTPLHYVALRNHSEIAEAILCEWDKLGQQKQGLLNHTNSNGNTALQEALHRKNFRIVSLLAKAGAKLGCSRWKDFFIRVDTQTNIEDIKKAIEAFKDDKTELMQFLNHRNGSDGYSLLHDAAQHRRFDVLELVLSHGADPTTMDVESTLDFKKVDPKTALHVAIWEGRPRIASTLLERAAQQCDKEKLARFVNRRNSVGKTALMDAAHQNRAEILKLLLHEYDADWALTDRAGFNALHYSAFRNHLACVKILLEWASGKGLDASIPRSPSEQEKLQTLLNQQSHDARLTPLHDVTAQGHGEIAQMLLTYHAEYEIFDQHGDSVLHRAIQSNHDDLLEPYLEYMSKDPDQEKFKRVLKHRNLSMKRTVLEAASVRNRAASVNLLKRYGA